MQNINIRPLFVLASLVIVIAGMKAIAPVLNLILVALLLAIILFPILRLMLNKGWSKALSLTLIIIILVIGAILLTLILGAGISQMSERLPYYEGRLTEVYNEALQWLAGKGANIEDIKSLDVFSPQNLFDISASFLGGIFSTFGNFVFVILLTIFILIEFADLQIKSDQGDLPHDSVIVRFGELGGDVRKYLSITAFSGFFVAVGQFILMLILGVDFPFIWAFLSFLFNFIPNIGFILTVVPPALLALLELGWIPCLIVIVGFIVINSIFDNVIKPKFIGEEFDMSILTVFLSLLFWTWVLGGIGAILAVPLTITLQRGWEILNEKTNQDNLEKKAFSAPEK